MSDDEIHAELLEEIVEHLIGDHPTEVGCGRLRALGAELSRRRRLYDRTHGPRCACWVCYRPYPPGIHHDEEDLV